MQSGEKAAERSEPAGDGDTAESRTAWKVWLHPVGASHSREVLQYATGETRQEAEANARARNDFQTDRVRTRRLGPEAEVDAI
jgi:hypothetical protein